MLRTGEQYKEGIRDGREVWIDGERVKDVTSHPAFKPIVDIKARMYDIQHEPEHQDVFGYNEGNDRNAVLLKPPHTQQDWWDKWNALDVFFKDIKGVVTRTGDETIGEMWSLHDGRDVLNKIDPRFAQNIDHHIHRVLVDDLFHVSAQQSGPSSSQAPWSVRRHCQAPPCPYPEPLPEQVLQSTSLTLPIPHSRPMSVSKQRLSMA